MMKRPPSLTSRRVRIGVFASSPSLVERIRALGERRHIELTLSTRGLEDALPAARAMEEQGIEVAVGRRGTAHLLRESLRIPVLSFPHRSLDLLVSLRQASSRGRKILLPVFRRPLSGVEILEEVLGIEILQGLYRDRESLGRAIATGVRRGCAAVVGGGVTQRFAERHGLAFFEIRTSDEDLAATLDNAVSVALAGREQRAVARRYQAVIDAASDGILAFDTAGCAIVANAAACRALRLPGEKILGRAVAELLPQSPVPRILETPAPVQDRIDQLHGERFVFSDRPILLDGETIGAVSTFRDIGGVMRSEHAVRRALSSGLSAKYGLELLVHRSPAMRRAVERARQYARTDSTVLLIGETGTGKEIFAHGIHRLSRRSRFPFVSINCAALPEPLLESELFGHEEGAFTGSRRGGKPGRFELAHQGTIFLDEIDSTSEAMQLRLLRVLQEGEVMRVGGDRVIPVDVRVIAAASRELEGPLREGRFRPDLFFRLNVLRLPIPPLRERREDIGLLLSHFIRAFCGREGVRPITLPRGYLAKLADYPWPGNVRQLKNFAERLVLNCSLSCDPEMLAHLYAELLRIAAPPPTDGAGPPPAGSGARPDTPAAATGGQTPGGEAAELLQALMRNRFHRRRTAAALGVSRTTLWRRLRALGLDAA